MLYKTNIAHTVAVVSGYMNNPGTQHWELMKWILRYLRGSSDMCLCITRVDLKLQAYVGADLAGDTNSKKSTTGFVLGFKFA